MYCLQHTAVAMTLVVSTLRIVQCGVLPQGMCRPKDLNIVPIPYETYFEDNNCWNVLYVVESKIFHKVDHAFLHFNSNGNGTYTMKATKVLNDGSYETNTFYNTYDYDTKIIRNMYVDSETGAVHHFEDYPLLIRPNNAALYIRCSYERGVPGVDTRYISIPSLNDLTDEDIETLLALDKSLHLRGNLYRLPYNLPQNECP